MALEDNLKIVQQIFKGDIRTKVIKQIKTFYNAVNNYKLPRHQYKKIMM